MKKILIMGSLAAVLFCSCNALRDPHYQKKSYWVESGYSETRLNDNTFLVYYVGNEDLSEDECHTYALRRAAEVTKDFGYTYFKVLNTEKSTDVSKYADTSLEKSDDVFDHGKKILHFKSFEKKVPTIRLKIKCFTEAPKGEDAICASEFMYYNFPYA